MLTDRSRNAPQGLAGGGDGGLSLVSLESGRPALPKGRTSIEPGDCLIIHTPGGAGYGDVAERRPELIARDLADELWSA